VTDRRTDGRTDGQTDGQTTIQPIEIVILKYDNLINKHRFSIF